MTNAAPAVTPAVSINDIRFEDAPLFSRNGNKEHFGNAIRIFSDAKVQFPGEEDLPVTAGGVLFKARHSGSVTFYAATDFNASFSRLLSNGITVPLSESTAIQLLKIREAEDKSHLKDIASLNGRAALDSGVKLVQGLWQRARTSETGRSVQTAANDLATEGRQMVRDLGSDAKQAIADSPTASRVVDIAQGAHARLSKLVWGKLGKTDAKQ